MERSNPAFDQKENMKLHNEDCIIQMIKMIDEGVQVDSVVTDPPYELGFMGKSWDSTGIIQKEMWNFISIIETRHLVVHW